MRVLLPWSNTFVSVGQVGINFSSFGEPESFFSAIERSGKMEEGKIATAWPQFGATERSPSMYIRMRVLPCYTVSVGQVGINFSSGEPAVLLVQLNVRENGRR
jgi:hypothetical protein